MLFRNTASCEEGESMTIPSAPVVSVVMPVFNGSEYLSLAVESILAQSFSDLEFLIVDDGSTDDSLEILRRYESQDSRIKIISRENTGMPRALNEGISLARGPFVARMDADDIAEPSRILKQVHYLQGHRECVAVGSALVFIDPDGEILAEQKTPESHEELLERLWQGDSALPHPTAMIRRDVLSAVGGYREAFAIAQDLDLWLRLSEIGRLANLPQALLRYRLHAASLTSTRRAQQLAEAEQIVRDAYQRRGQPVPEDFQLSWGPPPPPAKVFRSWARMAQRSGNRAVARKHSWNALCASPFSLSNVGIAATLLMPPLKKAG